MDQNFENIEGIDPSVIDSADEAMSVYKLFEALAGLLPPQAQIAAAGLIFGSVLAKAQVATRNLDKPTYEDLRNSLFEFVDDVTPAFVEELDRQKAERQALLQRADKSDDIGQNIGHSQRREFNESLAG